MVYKTSNEYIRKKYLYVWKYIHSVAISFRSLQRKIAIDDSRLIDDCNCRETNKRNSISSGFRHLLTYRNTRLIYPVS